MLRKLTRSLTEDIAPLLPAGVHFTEAHAIDAFDLLADCRTNRCFGKKYECESDVAGWRRTVQRSLCGRWLPASSEARYLQSVRKAKASKRGTVRDSFRDS